MKGVKKARPYWVTDKTHQTIKNICEVEETTIEGALTRMIGAYILKTTNLEKKEALKILKEEMEKEER